MASFPSVTALKDGSDQKVEAATLNQPINQLRERTDYLYGKLNELIGTSPFEAVRLNNVVLDPVNTPSQYSIVYVAPGTKYYTKALSDMLVTAIYPYSLGAPTSYAVGMVTSVTGNTGTVVLYGKVNLSSVLLSTLLDTDEIFRDGPYYLSTTEAGKMTANPKGMAILIGYFYGSTINAGYGDFADLAPQVKDLYEAHLHKNFPLASQPSGYAASTGTEVEDTWVVRGFRPNAYNQRWTGTTSYSRGDIITPTSTKENWHCYICTTGGTSGGTEPTWTTGVESISDGATVKWADWGVHTLLNVRGRIDGLGDDYTFWVVSSTGLIKDARLFWSTAGGTDNGWIGAPSDPDYGSTIGLPVLFYEREFEVGSLGLKVSLELGGEHSFWEGTANMASIPVASLADASGTWSIAIPEQTKGWHAHKVSGFATYTGSNTPADRAYAIQIFGTYVSQSTTSAENIKLAITSNGDFAGAGPTIEIMDINDDVICTLVGVAFSGTAKHIFLNVGGVDYYDLHMVISRTTVDGVTVTSTVADTNDSWEFPFVDEAVNSKFEYAIGFDPEMDAYYPPQPLLDIVLEANGNTLDARDVFNTGLGSYKANNRTLFWYHDLYMEAPWPIDWTAPGVVGSEEYLKNLMLRSSTVKVGAAGLVTSLTPKTGSSVRLTDKKTGLPATVGDLEIDASFNVSLLDTNTSGYMVFKTVNAQGQIVRGPVVEEIRAGAGVSLTSTSQNGKHQGIVTVSSDISGLTYGDFSDVFYLNAKSEVIPGRLFSYIKLLPWTTALTTNVPSAFVCKFRVPYALTGAYRVIVYATVFGLDEVVTPYWDNGRRYAGLKFTYSVGPDYSLTSGAAVVQKNFSLKMDPDTGLPADGVLEQQIELLNDVAVGCTGSISGSTKGYTPYDPFLLHNDPDMEPLDGQILSPFMAPFPQSNDRAQQSVTAGNIVAVKFERAGTHTGHTTSGTEYTGALGFISLKWKLVLA